MSVIWGRASDTWRAMRAEYQNVWEAQYAHAVHATNGNMVNARGMARGVDSSTVFSGSWNVVAAYASDELKEHLRNNPRTTLRAFERQWIEGDY